VDEWARRERADTHFPAAFGCHGLGPTPELYDPPIEQPPGSLPNEPNADPQLLDQRLYRQSCGQCSGPLGDIVSLSSQNVLADSLEHRSELAFGRIRKPIEQRIGLCEALHCLDRHASLVGSARA
jgi:hypothetical protein